MKRALLSGTSASQAGTTLCLKDDGWRIIGYGYNQDDMGQKISTQLNLVDNLTVQKFIQQERSVFLYSISPDLSPTAVVTVPERDDLSSFVTYDIAQLILDRMWFRITLIDRYTSPDSHKSVSTKEEYLELGISLVKLIGSCWLGDDFNDDTDRPNPEWFGINVCQFSKQANEFSDHLVIAEY